MTEVRDGFEEAARFFTETVARVPSGMWEAPGLGIWSVRELAAHTSESLSDDASPARTAERGELATVTDFYVRVVSSGQDAARERRAQEAHVG